MKEISAGSVLRRGQRSRCLCPLFFCCCCCCTRRSVPPTPPKLHSFSSLILGVSFSVCEPGYTVVTSVRDLSFLMSLFVLSTSKKKKTTNKTNMTLFRLNSFLHNYCCSLVLKLRNHFVSKSNISLPSIVTMMLVEKILLGQRSGSTAVNGPVSVYFKVVVYKENFFLHGCLSCFQAMLNVDV